MAEPAAKRRRASWLAAWAVAVCLATLSGPAQAHPVQADSVQADSVQAHPVQAHSAQAHPVLADSIDQRPQVARCLGDARVGPGAPFHLVGERVRIGVDVELLCAESSPLNLVLLIDAGHSMAGAKTRDVKAALSPLVTDLRLNEHPDIRVGVVTFGGLGAQTLCPLTNIEGRVLNCIDRVGAQGGVARIDLGVEEALKVAIRGRWDVRDRDSVRQAILIVTDSENANGKLPLQQAADAAKSQGMLITTVCIDLPCRGAALEGVASGPSEVYEIQSAALTPTLRDYREKRLAMPGWPERFSLAADLASGLQFQSFAPTLPGVLSYNAVTRRMSVDWPYPRGTTEIEIEALVADAGTYLAAQNPSAMVSLWGMQYSLPVTAGYLTGLRPAPVPTPVP